MVLVRLEPLTLCVQSY